LTIEHPFGIVEPDRPPEEPNDDRKIAGGGRNKERASGVSRAMKRDSRSLLAITLRTGLMVGLAVVLILVLLPAVLAAQAAGLR
jgi:hypothetical protein